MSYNKKPTFVHAPRLGLQVWENADGQDPKAILIGSPFATKVVSLFATGEETAAREIQLVIVRPEIPVTIPLITVEIPLNAGRADGVPPVDLFTTELRAILPKDGSNQPYLYLMPDDELRAIALTSITATEQLSIVALAGDFNDET